MPETFEALGVILIALLPGALYVWAIERLVGRWGIALSDRLLRFVGVSAVFHALAAPVTYWLWLDYVKAGRIGQTEVLPFELWLVLILYVGLPVILGTIVGMGTQRNRTWARFFTGPDPAPRAWDYLFGRRLRGWVRLRLKNGSWIGGVYREREDGRRSYVAGYPEIADIFLVEAVDLDPTTGEFYFADNGSPVVRESGILIRWDEVEYLEFIDA